MNGILPIDREHEMEAYILELEEQIMRLEAPLLRIMDDLPWEDRAILDSYIYAMRELQLCDTLVAYQKGKENARIKEKQGSE